MHIELSADDQNNSSNKEQLLSRPEDTQTISGSQVACAFAHIDQGKVIQNKQSGFQVLMVSMAAVFGMVSIYLIFTLVL
ncbi:MAG: hypothetical protein R8G33_11520 [Gammaproteobacteria bacterium]|nr:hypothetical protein [Gammaproteobacteria bacterium]